MNFESLVGRINLIQDALQAQAAHAVNFAQSESRGCLHPMPSQSKVNEVNLSLTARRSTFRSLCLQRTCLVGLSNTADILCEEMADVVRQKTIWSYS